MGGVFFGLHYFLCLKNIYIAFHLHLCYTVIGGKSHGTEASFVAYNFDFSYLKNGSPIVTLSSFGIAFNKGAIESLGTPEQVIIGYDKDAHTIGVRAKGDDTSVPSYEFANRVKNDWIRIGAKDFMKHLSRTSGIDFLDKSKQFIADYDSETQTLVIIVDEEHLK